MTGNWLHDSASQMIATEVARLQREQAAREKRNAIAARSRMNRAQRRAADREARS